MPDDADKLRDELRQIGQRRIQHRLNDSKLVADTRAAIHRAKGKLSMTEIAELVDLERTSMYHTYVRG